jgi:hypothetical protein
MNNKKSRIWRRVTLVLLIICLALAALILQRCNAPLERVTLRLPIFDAKTLDKLRNTRATNLQEVLRQKQLASPDAGQDGFVTTSPYVPAKPLSRAACDSSPNCTYATEHVSSLTQTFPGSEAVYQWWTTHQRSAEQAEVCGVKFDDDTHTHYQLKTFDNLSALQTSPGFQLTHYHACGTCSTLQDLAVYGELDLTKMAKVCTKRATLASKQECMEEIGFTRACAETWAYNGSNTGRSCARNCVKAFGLLPLLFGYENASPVDANGTLNACLMCDEMISGPGFQYAAGRTRRDSGIISEIDRPSTQVYNVTHQYFQ